MHWPIEMLHPRQNWLVLDNVLSLLNASVHLPKIFSLNKCFRNITTTTSEPVKNEPAAPAAGQTLPAEAPPTGKIDPFSKMAVTFEPLH